MRRKIAFLLPLTLAAGLMVGIGVASAHQCPEGDTSSPECHETEVYDDWRPNYVPVADLAERDEQSKRDAQRWREECNNRTMESQQCLWVYGGTSVMPYGSDPDGEAPRPNELHVGYAANHCFLAEGAHDCNNHDEGQFGTHDSHGGAVYADVCLSPNDESKYCDDGLTDTQVVVMAVDHLTCPAGCMDEYHVVRPLDSEYTQKQTENSIEYISGLDSPEALQRHVCGYEENSFC